MSRNDSRWARAGPPRVLMDLFVGYPCSLLDSREASDAPSVLSAAGSLGKGMLVARVAELEAKLEAERHNSMELKTQVMMMRQENTQLRIL